MDIQIKTPHNTGIFYKLKSDISLLNYHINLDRVKVWQYLHHQKKDESLASDIARSMDIKNIGIDLTEREETVLETLIKRFHLNIKAKDSKTEELVKLMEEMGENAQILVNTSSDKL